MRMTTPIDVSARQSSKALISSMIVCGRKALRTSGLLMVILAMPSSTRSKSRSWYSFMGTHVSMLIFLREQPCIELQSA